MTSSSRKKFYFYPFQIHDVFVLIEPGCICLQNPLGLFAYIFRITDTFKGKIGFHFFEICGPQVIGTPGVPPRSPENHQEKDAGNYPEKISLLKFHKTPV